MTIIERNGSGRRTGASLCRRVQCFLRPHPEMKKSSASIVLAFFCTTLWNKSSVTNRASFDGKQQAYLILMNFDTLLRPVKRTPPPVVTIVKNISYDNRLLLFDLWHTSVCSCSEEEAEACADARWASYPITHLSFPSQVFVQSFPKLPQSAAQSSLFVQTSTLRLLDIVSR